MRKIFLSLVSFCALCALVGCGSSSSTVSVPANPSGGNLAGFSNASLPAGTSYVFALNGINNVGNFAVIGTFATDGQGNITSGTRDTVTDSSGQTLNETLTSAGSSYFVNTDGRGQLVLSGPSGRAIYRFVLHAPTTQQPSEVGELFQDGTTSNQVIADAVGTIQQVSGTPATPTGTYVVGLNGEDGARYPYGAVGAINFNANTFTGNIDENDDFSYALETQPQAASGTITLSSARGIATLKTPSGINTGTHNFVVYYVSPTQFDLVSTDQNFLIYGNATQQTSYASSASTFTGDQVFSISGYDTTPGPRAEAGRLTLNGDGTLSNAVEDSVNLNHVYAGVSLTANSSYTVDANGRWTANFVNPANNTTTGLAGWQVSFGALPQNQKSFVLTTNSNILETGVMLGQTVPIANASIAGNYAESLSGYNVGGQDFVELTGNLCTNSAICSTTPVGTFSGTQDSQSDDGGLSLDYRASGTYDTGAASYGRSTAASLENIPVAMYTVDDNTIFFVSSQQGSVYQGALINQQ